MPHHENGGMTSPRTLACLSIRQPWASLYVNGIKPVENRGWACSYRGPLLIHASKTWKNEEQEAYNHLLQIAIDRGDTRRQKIIAMAPNLRGGLLGLLRMTGCVSRDVWVNKLNRDFYNGWDEWFTGPFGFMARDAQPFELMVPYKGQQGLFRMPIDRVPGLAELLRSRGNDSA